MASPPSSNAASTPQLRSPAPAYTPKEESAAPQAPDTMVMTTAYVDTDDMDIEAADDEDDYSDYHSASDASMSMVSSVRDYVYENGRRYHRYGEGKYPLPNDEVEQDRLDLMHHIHCMALGGELHFAPVGPETRRVLDCGTGTGIWALDYGEIHPEAEVLGVDLSPIQPCWAFSNVRFEVDDLEQEWIWPENHFDFIHSRSICAGIRDYQRFVEQAYTHLKPGCYFELVEQSLDVYAKDGTMGPETALYKYIEGLKEGFRRAGISHPTPATQIACLEKAGFVDIKCGTVNIPWGKWPKHPKMKELGATVPLCGVAGFEAYAMASLTRILGWDVETAKQICRGAYEEVASGRVHAVAPVVHAYGRKPEA